MSDREILLQILERLERLEARLTRPASPDDAEVLRGLLPRIAGKIGASTFTAREVLQDPALKALVGGLNCRQLGKLFGRNIGVTFDGLCLDKSILEGNSQLWFLTRE